MSKAETQSKAENKTETQSKAENKAETQEIEVKLKLEDAKKYFTAPVEVLKKIRFSNVSLFSSTPPDQAKYTTELLLSYYTKEQLKTKTLTDATACIGGNTWIFADYVKKVIANELSILHAKMLSNNMQILGKNNVEVLNKNYLSIYLTLTQDIIFLDPPWGGVNYKKENPDIILLNEKNEPVKFANIVLSSLQYRCETMILKLPVNYNVQQILDNCTFININNIVINAVDGFPLYRLVILSHLQLLQEPKKQTFPRLQYKKIIFQEVK